MVTRGLGWIVAVIAYLALLTTPCPEEVRIRFASKSSGRGSPTVSSALLRILYSIPSPIVLALLGFVGAIVW